MEAENVDVDTTFLYGDVDEEIHTDQPDGLEDGKYLNMKCKLQRVHHGTKQAARQWNNKLNKHLDSMRFNALVADPRVYISKKGNKYNIIVIYVDDLMIFTKTEEKTNEIKRAVKEAFSIKELGELGYCLGIEIHRNRSKKMFS
uniref:Uncharacterized protein AlNc14C452G11740 n=1 Tax=Albugo laibachii Nc14 TaxID=890382 RepID=F0WZZ8_9STRA|nr:hypothetical protein ALNC14_132230 [Albugo laibachii Nc14]|eukprot:CCA27079.1 hypothetical protein ALNC14_132230 [Albugo laibachii Nc14]